MLRTTRARLMVSAQRDEALQRWARGGTEFGRQRGEEYLAEVVDELGGKLLWPPPARHEGAERDEDLSHIAVGERVDQAGQLGAGRIGGTRRHHLVQCGERVPRRAPAASHGGLDRLVIEIRGRPAC